MDHQPALLDAKVAELKALIAHLLIDIVPRVDRQCLRNHLRHHLEGVGNAGDKRQRFQVLGIIFVVEFAVCHHVPGAW